MKLMVYCAECCEVTSTCSCGEDSKGLYHCGGCSTNYPKYLTDEAKVIATGNKAIQSQIDKLVNAEKANAPKTGIPLSAKAKSVWDLQKQGSVMNGYRTQSDILVYPTIHNDSDAIALFAKAKATNTHVFARPCPLTPVHGYFDSRRISDFWELKKLCLEIWRNKPSEECLEIVLMREINAIYSGIITPKAITIGESNDGATGGKKAIVIRTQNDLVDRVIGYNLREAYTKQNESTFVEIVAEENPYDTNKSVGLPTVVQVRSGNESNSASNDFIPYDVEVERVHEVTDSTDLVAWQKLVKTFEKGDVIFAASLACHGAVHGVLNNIPVMTSHSPVIGEKLEAGTIPPLDVKKVHAKLVHLFMKREVFERTSVEIGWKLLHLLGSNFQAGGEEIVAYALHYLLLGGMSACLGEYRYAKGKKVKGIAKGFGRDAIYKNAFDDKKRASIIIYRAYAAFLDENRWDSGAFGGANWANCSKAAIALMRQLGRFMLKPDLAGLKRASELANDLAHQQHNGGILFSKFGISDSQSTTTITDVSRIFQYRSVVETLLKLRDVEEAKTLPDFVKSMVRKTPKYVRDFLISREEKEAKEKEAYEKLLAKQAEEEEKEKEAFQAKLSKSLATIHDTLPTLEYLIRPLNKEGDSEIASQFRIQVNYMKAGKKKGFFEVDIPVAGLEIGDEKLTEKTSAGTDKTYAKLAYGGSMLAYGNTFAFKADFENTVINFSHAIDDNSLVKLAELKGDN